MEAERALLRSSLLHDVSCPGPEQQRLQQTLMLMPCIQPRGQSKPKQIHAQTELLRLRSGTSASSRTSVKMALPPIVSATAQSAVLSATSNILAQAITAYRSDV